MEMIGIGLIFLFDGPGIFWLLWPHQFCCSSKSFKIEPYLEKLAKKTNVIYRAGNNSSIF